MDILAISEAIAAIAATGAVSTVSGQTALEVVARIRQRLRDVMHGDQRSLDALMRALENPSDEGRIRELAAAVAWYAQRDQNFAAELAAWTSRFSAERPILQNVRAGRDAYTAGRDITITYRPESH
jgi:hypothetical protein